MATIWPRVILTPDYTLFHPALGRTVNSAAEWRDLQRFVLASNRARAPKLHWPEPWQVVPVPDVFVNCGRWLLRCACGDCPMVHPGWSLSLCLGCGAIYEPIVMPADADAIARVLCARANINNRNWSPPETLADINAENVAHGEPVSV